MSRDQIADLKDDLSGQIKELGLVKADVYDKHAKQAANMGTTVFDLLLKDGAINVEEMLSGFSKKYNIPFDIKPEPIVPEIEKFPVSFCLKNAVVPLKDNGKSMEMGMCHPSALNSLKNLGLMLGKKIDAKFIPPEVIFESILQKHIHTTSDMEKSKLLKQENIAKSKKTVSQSNKTVELKMENVVSGKKPAAPALDISKLKKDSEKKKEKEEQNIPMSVLDVPKKEEAKAPEVNIEELKKSAAKIDERKKVTEKPKEQPSSASSAPKLDLAGALAKAKNEETTASESAPAKEEPKKTSTKSQEVVEEDAAGDVTGDVVNVVDEILSEAVSSGVSDIHIEIFKETAQIRFRGNGSLLAQSKYRKFISTSYPAVVARIKILANLDIAERRLPQDGKISYVAKDGTEVDFRISVLPTNLGERIVIRILNSSSLAVTLSAIGFTEKQEEEFLQAISMPQGMILVTGPTGSGKSTTLYGAMNQLNTPDVNILTAEDPVEYTMSGISQVQVREDIGLTFASALRSFLRQDPEIILVGEIRDAETADIASKAALTGHLVLSTLHTNSAIGAISRLVNMGLPPYLVSSALSLVVAQRLIRKNCEKCSEEVDKTSKEIKKFMDEYNISADAKLMKGKGCKACNNTGYSGRRGVHEVLVVTAELEAAISSGQNESTILKLAEEQGFKTISESGQRFLMDGTVSVEEYLRVIPKDE
jgi:type IV pilus assembly protein PilB